MDLSKPVRGSMHDSEILTRSQLNLRLADIQNNEIVQYTFYADKGYPISIGHGRGSFRNTQNMLPFQRLENTMMKSPRSIAAEFDFDKPANIMKYNDYHKNHKLGKSQATKSYLVGCLLCNAHSCLYGNTTSTYFRIGTPELEEYFNV
jgi:hypothetical protein